MRIKPQDDFKVLDWLDRYMSGHDGFIAGGCFKDIFTDKKVKDLDIFFKNETDMVLAEKYFSGQKEEYSPYYSNEKVVAFKNKDTGIVVELIKKTFGSPEEVIKKFDFTVAKFAMYKSEVTNDDGSKTFMSKVAYHDDYFEHILLKRLVADDKLSFPISSFERMIKYGKYGFYPCRETKAKLLEGIRKETTIGDDLNKSLYDGID